MGGGWSDALLPAAILAVEVASVLFVSVRAARRIVPEPGAVLDRAVVACFLGLVEVVAILQVLGIVGVLHRGPVLLAHLVVAGGVAAFVPATDIAPTRHRPGLMWLAVVMTGAWFAVVSAAIGVKGVSQEADTVQYHLPNIAYWLRGGSLWKLPYATAGYFTHTYPSNGELVGLWAILPSHDDRLAYATPLAFALLAVLAGAVIARELRGSATLGALGSIAVLVTPLSFDTQTHSLMVDWATSATIAAGVAFALMARRAARDSATTNTAPRWVALSALSFGFAMGTKYTVLPLAVVCLLALIALQPRARWWASFLIAVPSAAALSLLWFVRDWIVIGNPLFPKGVTVGGKTVFRGGESPLTKLSTSLLDHVKDRHWSVLREWLHLVNSLVAFALVVIIVGAATALCLAIRKRDAGAIVIAVLIALGTVFYFATPYTGGGPTGVTFLVSSQVRYFMPVLLLAGAAAGAALGPLALVAAAAGIAGGGLHLARGGPGYRQDFAASHGLLAVVAALVVVAGAAYWIVDNRPDLVDRLRVRDVRNRALVLTAVVALLGSVVVMRQLAPTRADDPAAALLGHADGQRILAVGVNNLRALLGNKLDNNVITPGGGGAAHETPYRSPAQLDSRIAALHPAFLVVGRNQAAIPTGWQPDAQWHQVGRIGPTVVFTTG